MNLKKKQGEKLAEGGLRAPGCDVWLVKDGLANILLLQARHRRWKQIHHAGTLGVAMKRKCVPVS
jgi:hypothetical protein